MIFVEKVICVKCGSIGYTASPEQVNCSDCGGKHKALGPANGVPKKRDRALSLLCTKAG